MKKILLSLLVLASAQDAFAYDFLSKEVKQDYVDKFKKCLSDPEGFDG